MIRTRLKYAGLTGVAAFVVGGAVYIQHMFTLTQHWALFASTTPSGAYHLFLEPYPDQTSCERAQKIITSARGYARCEPRLAFVSKRGEDTLFWEFLSPGAPGIRICTRRS